MKFNGLAANPWIEGTFLNTGTVTGTGQQHGFRVLGDGYVENAGNIRAYGIQLHDNAEWINKAGATLETEGWNNIYDNGRFINYGTFDGDTGFVGRHASHIENHGTLIAANHVTGTYGGYYLNTGDITAAGLRVGGALSVSADFHNSGTIYAHVDVHGNGVNDGLIAGPAMVFDAGNSFTNSGSVVGQIGGRHGGTFINNGTVTESRIWGLDPNTTIINTAAGYISVIGDSRLDATSEFINRGEFDLNGTGTAQIWAGGQYTFEQTGVMNLDIAGTTVGSGYDQLYFATTGSILSLGGSTLNIRSDAYAPTVGESYEVIKHVLSANVVGHFGDITGLDAHADSGVVYDYVWGATGLTLTAVSVSASASTGNDALVGDASANLINGLQGDDLIFGREGNDTILGGDGNDIITGGAGNDILAGGDGADQFVFNAADASDDVIADFELGVDELVLNDGLTISSYVEIDIDGDGTNDSTLVTLSDNSTVTLENLTGLSSEFDLL